MVASANHSSARLQEFIFFFQGNSTSRTNGLIDSVTLQGVYRLIDRTDRSTSTDRYARMHLKASAIVFEPWKIQCNIRLVGNSMAASSNSMASSTTEATGNNQPTCGTLYVSTIPPPLPPPPPPPLGPPHHCSYCPRIPPPHSPNHSFFSSRA
jgi:hypothetical protein